MKNRNFRILKGLRQRQAGYTLVELAITVSIISLLVVSSIAGVQGLLLANKVNRTLTQTTVATATITKLITATNNPDLGTLDLIKLGAWDSSAVRGGGTSVENPFAGTITVGPNLSGVGSYARKSGFWYRISGVPQTHCASLVTSFYSTSPGIWINKTPATSLDEVGGTTLGDTSWYRKPGQNDKLDQLSTACLANTLTNGLVEIALFIPT
jgi:prepilin-type N-terminal cleavage/methylation domain-containing protein